MKDQSIKSESENFTHNIAWLRKHYGFSKKRMAEILKISIKSLNKIESGEMPPRLGASILCNIHDNFGIRPEHQIRQKLGE